MYNGVNAENSIPLTNDLLIYFGALHIIMQPLHCNSNISVLYLIFSLCILFIYLFYI